MEKKNIKYFHIAAICFAISGLMFTIASILGARSYFLTLGLSQVTFGLVFNILAMRQDKESDKKDDEK